LTCTENNQNLIFKILRSTVCGETLTPEDKALFTGTPLLSVCKIAKAHDLAHLLKGFFDKENIPFEKNYEKLEQAEILAICRHERIAQTTTLLVKALENAKIPFILLKGSVLRGYYPEPWMRTSCDIDVLVHENDLKKTVELLANEYGYSWNGKKNYHDVSLFTESKVHIELHHSIKENKPNLDKVLEKAWDYAKPKNGGAEHVFTNEFFLFHQLAHCAYHFTAGGCGIKPILDLWIIRNKMNLTLDKTVFEGLLEKAKLTAFYNAVVDLSDVWFSGKEETPLTKEMTEYILKGGVYGSAENGITVRRSKKKGKVAYFLSRLFMPYSLMKLKYPVIAKFPPLLPFFYVVRLFSLLNPKTAKKAVKETKITLSTTDESVAKTQNLLKQLEI